MEQLDVATVNYEPGWAGVGLDDIFGFGAGVFEASRKMFNDGFREDFIEVRGFDCELTGFVDLGGKFEELSDVVTSKGASDEDGGIRQKVEIALKFVKDTVGIVHEVGFGEDDDDALASVDDLAGEGLVEFRMWLGGVNQ